MSAIVNGSITLRNEIQSITDRRILVPMRRHPSYRIEADELAVSVGGVATYCRASEKTAVVVVVGGSGNRRKHNGMVKDLLLPVLKIRSLEVPMIGNRSYFLSNIPGLVLLIVMPFIFLYNYTGMQNKIK